MRLRLPSEQLAGCCWLPRFLDKARALRDGSLPWIYRRGFTSRLGLDGVFLRSFRLTGEEFVAAVRSATDDDGVAAWFLAQPGVSAERIAKWNTFAPNLGRKGHPMHLALVCVKPVIYPGLVGVKVDSFFELIARDEAA